jgi:hypothetical protein
MYKYRPCGAKGLHSPPCSIGNGTQPRASRLATLPSALPFLRGGVASCSSDPPGDCTAHRPILPCSRVKWAVPVRYRGVVGQGQGAAAWALPLAACLVAPNVFAKINLRNALAPACCRALSAVGGSSSLFCCRLRLLAYRYRPHLSLAVGSVAPRCSASSACPNVNV